MPDLKLIAMDAEDLSVISAHLQDAVVKVGDMAFLKRDQRFALVANRFDWAGAGTSDGKNAFARRRCGLRFERVRGARVQGLDLKKTREFLVLLALTFTPHGAGEPGGTVTLTFSGGAAVRLDVEVLEAEMKDLGGAWTTRRKPAHEDPPKT